MILSNLKLADRNEQVSISVNAGMIDAMRNNEEPDFEADNQLFFTDAIVFPGLINSHDHLDFNCFPALGTRVYMDYTEWGRHIHRTYKDEIEAVLNIPSKLRVQWGIYKNLLAGVTTVVNHGDYLPVDTPLIHVYQRAQSLHSVMFQKNWRWKLNNPFQQDRVVVIHTGEGTDERSAREIGELLRWNLFNRKLVGVHAVAMNTSQAKKFKGLVWCPGPNRFLFNKDAAACQLKKHTDMVFGTDSTLTGHWNIWEHIRLARSAKQVSDEELFHMLTAGPANLWGKQAGALIPGKEADIVIARKGSKQGWDDFFAIDPSDILLVMHKGSIRLFDHELLPQMNNIKSDLACYHPVLLSNRIKYVEGNLPHLMASIRKYYSQATFPSEALEKVKLAEDD
jgi:cytosine/adenosine deaminase-related metal-dependent hydrolase